MRVFGGGRPSGCSSGATLAAFSSPRGSGRGGQTHPELEGQGWGGKASLVSLPVVAPRSGGDMGIPGCWAGQWGPGGCLTVPPLLSAGEAFLGSFVASGMGPSASSHGSPVPLPSDLSFRSPTPSNLPMVQLWAAHAHEGKECARWAGLRAVGHCPWHLSILPTPFHLRASLLPWLGGGGTRPGHPAALLFLRYPVLPLVSVTGPLHKLFPPLWADRKSVV